MILLLGVYSSAYAQDPLNIHIISGSNEYESEASLREYEQYLEEHYNVSVTASWVGDGAEDLPGIEHVSGSDLLLVFARRMKLRKEQMDILRRHWKQGKPVVGIRTASHAFRESTNQVFDHEVMGGNYQGHFEDHPVEVRNVEASHPILKGVAPFTSRKMYKAGELADGATVLQEGTTRGGYTHPVTWTHCYNGGRTVYTSLGIPQDFQNENFRRLITNAIFWAAGRDRK